MNPADDSHWHSLETLVSTIEQRAYQAGQSGEFLEFTAIELRAALMLAAVAIDHLQPTGAQRLARYGGPLPVPEVHESLFHLQPGEARPRSSVLGDGTTVEIDHCFEGSQIVRLTALPRGNSTIPAATCQEVLTTVAVLIGQHLLRVCALRAAERSAAQQQVLELVQELAETGTDRHSAHRLCASIQRRLGIDRCSLLLYRGRVARLVASSVSAQVRRQSEPVRQLERTATQFRSRDLPLRIRMGGEGPPLPAKVQHAVTTLVRESQVRVVEEILLTSEGEASPAGGLLLEHFSADWPSPPQAEVLRLAQPHLKSAALREVRRRKQNLAARLRSWLVSSGGKWLAAALVIGGLTAAGLLVQVDFDIAAEGTLLPQQRRAVFAPVNAVVDALLVQQGSTVKADDPLLVLRSPELDLQQEQLQGEIAALQSRLDGLAAARLRSRATGSSAADETELSALEADVRAQLNGARGQLEILNTQRKSLTIRAPLSGRVDRWNLETALAGRPVAHGQFLLDVLDVEGPWQVELRIPDDEMAAVLEAQQQGQCPVTFLFRTQSQQRYESCLQELADSVQLGAGETPYVGARMPVEGVPEDQLRVGASVLARIHCGQRSAGYVYLREVLEFLQRTFWI